MKSILLAAIAAGLVAPVAARATELPPLEMYQHAFPEGGSAMVFQYEYMAGSRVVAVLKTDDSPTQRVFRISATVADGDTVLIEVPATGRGVSEGIRVERAQGHVTVTPSVSP